jgi:hypothetical protein
MKQQISSYEQQAIDFLEANHIEFTSVFIGHDKHFPDDKESRDRWLCTFKKREHPIKAFEVRFGQSIENSKNGKSKPSAYDVLTCLTKNDPGTFEDFCGDFGYDEDSRKSEKIYRAVQTEWRNVSRFFTSTELEQLQEIQ